MLEPRAMTEAADTFVPEIRYTDSARVACDGDEGALGHPRVWMQIDERGYADCGYCDRRFVLAGSPADKRR